MRKLIALSCLLGLASPMAMADTLVLNKVHKDAQASADRPSRGMHMQQVAARYGQPQDRISAVGNPPISRWVYADYTVYFERDKVLHAVQRHR